MKRAGIAVAVAAGNDDIDACRASPAFSRNGLTVAASNYDDTKAKYSNWGSCIDIWAPGTSIKVGRCLLHSVDPTMYSKGTRFFLSSRRIQSKD